MQRMSKYADAVVKAFDGNEAMANRYLESKGVRPTEPLQYSAKVTKRHILALMK